MLRDANPTLKTRIGPLAYVLSGLRQLRRRPARFRIRLDDQPPITRVGQGLLIANLGRLQGGITLVPDAQPDDGVLDVAVLGTRTPVDWLRLATQILLRRQRQPEQQRQAGPPLELFRARRVVIDCNRPQPVERDGDPAGSTRRLVLRSSRGPHLAFPPVRRIGAEHNPEPRADRGVAPRPDGVAFQQELFAVAEHHWPQPRLHTRARRAEQRWVVGCARWVWTHRPRRQAVGLVQQLRRP